MRIDFIIGRIGHGGAERVLVALSEYFVNKGHVVSVLTFDIGDDLFQVAPGINRIRLQDKSFPIVKINNLINLVKHYSKKDTKPDLAISFLTATNLVAILAGKIKKVPVIACEHNNHLFVPHPKWLTHLNWKYVYRMAKFVTVLTNFDVAFFKNFKSNVVVMPNPCSFPLIESNDHKREKVILAIGSLDRYHHKGFDSLIAILSPITEQMSDWKVKIVGGGEKGKLYIQELLTKNGLSSHVELTGFTKDVRKLMHNSSIFILPSRYEGLPMVLLEAMSQGMACISYDCITGPAEMIKHEINGLLIPDQDIESMQMGLLRLIHNPTLRNYLGNNAIESLNKYSIERIYERWVSLINVSV